MAKNTVSDPYAPPEGTADELPASWLEAGWLPDGDWGDAQVPKKLFYQIAASQFPGCLKKRYKGYVISPDFLADMEEILTPYKLERALWGLNENRRTFNDLKNLLDGIYAVIEHRYAQQQEP